MTQSAPTADRGSQSMTSEQSNLKIGNGTKLDITGAWILAMHRQGKLDARDLHIIDGRAQGMTEREIGLELGITQQSVHCRIKRMAVRFSAESLPVLAVS